MVRGGGGCKDPKKHSPRQPFMPAPKTPAPPTHVPQRYSKHFYYSKATNEHSSWHVWTPQTLGNCDDFNPQSCTHPPTGHVLATEQETRRAIGTPLHFPSLAPAIQEMHRLTRTARTSFRAPVPPRKRGTLASCSGRPVVPCPQLDALTPSWITIHNSRVDKQQ